MQKPYEDDRARLTAEGLRDAHGENALLRASMLAYEAVLAKNREQCRFWRDVIDLLEADPIERRKLN